jgi:DNA-binding winged helix-turn-helix (wHTH) protein
VVSFAPFTLYPAQRRLEREGHAVKVGSRALDILMTLVERAGEIVSEEQLTAQVWRDVAVDESELRVHVAALRKALADSRHDARYLASVPGQGPRQAGKSGQLTAGENRPV